MTYPPSSSGYPPSQQPTTQFSAPTQQFGKPEQASAQSPAVAAAGPSKLPFILLAAIGVLGLLVYLFSFGPQFKIESTDFPQLGSATGTSLGLGLAVVAALLSALIAAASLLPNQKAPVGIIAAVAVLAFLLVIAEVIQTPEGVSLGWALYVVIFLTLVQAALGIGALLLDAGIITAAATRAASRPAVAMGRPVSRAARRPLRPASRHTASRRRRSPRRPARARASRSRRPRRLRRISPATRRHNLCGASVNPALARKELLYR
jgi:hypothetical protein